MSAPPPPAKAATATAPAAAPPTAVGATTKPPAAVPAQPPRLPATTVTAQQQQQQQQPDKRLRMEDLKVEDLLKQIQHLQETNTNFRKQITAGERQHCELQQNFIHKIQQLSTANDTLQKMVDRVKADNLVMRQAAERYQKDANRLLTEQQQWQTQMDEIKAELARLQASPASVAAMEEEYLSLLQEWVSSHQNSVRVNALAVFHGTKPKAKQLWQVLSEVHKVSIADLLAQVGMKRSLLYVKSNKAGEEDLILGLAQNNHGGGGSRVELDVLLDTLLRTGKDDVNRRIIAWLEEQNGWGKFADFARAFGSASLLLTPSDIAQNADLLCIPAFDTTSVVVGATEEEEKMGGEDQIIVVLVKRAELVLCQMFCRYLQQRFGDNALVRAAEFQIFLEKFPGARELREKVTAVECTAATMASKFPHLLHFWKGLEGVGMCCLRENKERAEADQLEQQRKRVEQVNLAERERFDAERRLAEEKANFDKEERKRNEWRQQQQPYNAYASQLQQPPTTATTASYDHVGGYAPPPSQQQQQHTYGAYSAPAVAAPPSHASYQPQGGGGVNPYGAYSAPPPQAAGYASYAPQPPSSLYPSSQQPAAYFPPPPASWQPPPPQRRG